MPVECFGDYPSTGHVQHVRGFAQVSYMHFRNYTNLHRPNLHLPVPFRPEGLTQWFDAKLKGLDGARLGFLRYL